MKKILSLTLAALMLVSMIPTAMATTTDWESGTTITLNGSGTEAYTVTVPATMSPGDTATVKAEGTWAADKYLQVHAPTSVTLSYGAQSMDVAISWANGSSGFSLFGNSVDPVSKEVEISVEDASRLFGTWEGILEYDVVLIEKGDVNRDGVINEDDITMITDCYVNSTHYTEEQQANVLTYGDYDGDGSANATDVQYLRRVINGLPSKIPAQSE